MARKRIKAGVRQRDVAAATGVSTATVSAVVNGRAAQYGICRATQEKVQAAIRQMGYAPSLAALDMVAGRNSLVGLAVTANYPGSDRLIAAMEPALAQVAFRLIVICLPADPAAAVARITDLARYGIGALAIYPARVLPLPGIGCPVVMVGKAGVGLPADCGLSAVQQLGQATARWLELASRGTPPGELLLEPVPGVTPISQPSAVVPPTPPPSAVAPSAQTPHVAPPARRPERPPESQIKPSESIQMAETVASDPVGQVASNPQDSVPAEPVVTETVAAEPIVAPEPIMSACTLYQGLFVMKDQDD
ncbi:MAG: LacI family DNA-binding transcriptional regulator, partial [bacterium]